jgi:hypothetical protein
MKFWQSPSWRVFVIVFALGLAWAAATGQVWEDFMITYRASKNLAEGKGLVFTEGQRVHSFTSPLGVLLPAASYLLTGRSSDVGALWIFRLMSLAALGGTAVLMWQTVRRLCPATAAPAVLLVALLAIDSKTIAFATSGMETAFLLLFFAWALWTIFLRPARFALHLGLAWAGLMWSRPDSCIYIAALGAGLLLFAPGEGGYLRSRPVWLRQILVAGAICAVVYGPWFAWAWSYYGSPVPHTITAKGLYNEFTAAGLAKSIIGFPGTVIAGKSSLMSTFMPYYGGVPVWTTWAPKPSFVLALIPLLLCFLPFVRWEARVASFAYVIGHIYLTTIIGFPVPWYIPHVTFLGVVALSLGFGQLLGVAARWRQNSAGSAGRWLAYSLRALAVMAVLGSASVSLAMARQAYLEMTLIERDVRTAIGLWLRNEARSPQDTVFLEPLGFIGFYSGLKMLDFPGLCSPEVVAARRQTVNRSYPFCWGELIPKLRPDWLVMRPFERTETNNNDRLVLSGMYDLVKTFDAMPQVNQAKWVPIKGYFEYNAVFEIYRLKLRPETRARAFSPLVAPITIAQFTTKESPLPIEPAGSGIKAHAPSRLVIPVPPKALLVQGGFGIYEGAYAKPRPEATDGAEFIIEHVAADGKRTVLLQRPMNPWDNKADHGLQQFDLDLPAPGGEIEFTVRVGQYGSNAYDWSYWYDLRFGMPPH